MSNLCVDQTELIQSSGLFDQEFYLRQVPEAIDFENGPLAHYLTTTGEECYQPHPLFDAKFYISSHPDLQACAAQIHPLLHYVQHGGYEGRDPHPLFSTIYYLKQCPQAQGENPLIHFAQSNGEISPHEMFDINYYRSKNPTVSGNPLVYFLLNAETQFTSPHPIFDAAYYLAQLPAEQRKCSNPLLHFLASDEGKTASPHPLFNARDYLNMRWDIAALKWNAFMHYLRHGYKEGYEPNRLFHSQWYLEKHPELTANDINPLLHYEQNLDNFHPLFDQQYYRLKYRLKDKEDALLHCLENGLTNEPLCESPLLGTKACLEKNIPITAIDLAFDLLLEQTNKPFERLFIVLALIPNTPGRMLDTNIGALQRRHGIDDVLVLYSHHDVQTERPQWLPENSRAIYMHDLYAGSNFMIALLVAAFVAVKKPPVIQILESHLLLLTFGTYPGVVAKETRTLLYLYGYEVFVNYKGPEYWFYTLDGPSIGSAVKNFDCIVTDSDVLRKAIELKYPEQRLYNNRTVTLRALTPKYTERLLDLGSNRRLVSDGHVLWASRLSSEKRPDILAAIAAKSPETQFLVYGSLVPHRERAEAYLNELEKLPNIRYAGPYKDFSKLELEKAIAFLYTTDTDGVPLVLVEATALGLPVIAPRIGGIPELISQETGWLIEQFDDVDAYVQAIQSIRDRPDEALRRLNSAQAMLRKDFSFAALERDTILLAEFF